MTKNACGVGSQFKKLEREKSNVLQYDSANFPLCLNEN
jgi:hypothetical protein